MTNSIIFIAAYFFINQLDSYTNVSSTIFSVTSVIMYSMNNGNFVLSRTMLMSELKENSRAAIFSIEGFLRSVMMMLYHKLTGFAYDNIS